MDFHSLTRKELQTLCKKNSIPANTTNVLMADSLQALEHVEGLEEILNQSPEKAMNGSKSIPRTASRTAARRNPIKEPESSQTLARSRRGTRRAVADEVDQENTEVPKTPAAPSTRKRVPQKTEAQKKEISALQHAYSTRRSVRLLQKTMANLSLDNGSSVPFEIEECSADMTNGSEKSGGSVDKGSNMQTVSEVSSERMDVSEVSSKPKSNGSLENERPLKDVVGENKNTDTIGVVDDSKPKSEPESEIDGFIMVPEVMDESHEEGSEEHDDAAVTEFAPEAEDPQGVSAEVMIHAPVSQTSLLEVNESMDAEKSVGPISVTHGQVDINMAEEQDSKNDNSESKYATVEESEKVKHVENAEEAVKPHKLTLSFSDEQQRILSGKGSDLYETEDDYGGKFDFESESATEEDSDDDSTEGESSEDEAVDEVDESPLEFTGDNMQAGEGDLGSNNSVANATEVAEVAMETQFHPSTDEMPKPVKQMSPYQSSTLVDVSALPAEEFACAPKTPTVPPLAANQLAHQFPRPTPKSSGKKQSAVEKYIYDDNEEGDNDSNDKTLDSEGVEMKKDDDPAVNDIMQKAHQEIKDMSIRQLKKMIKQIELAGKPDKTDKHGTKMTDKPRTALQEVPENQIAVKEN